MFLFLIIILAAGKTKGEDKPIVFVGANLLTMGDLGQIENGSLKIAGGKIIEIGKTINISDNDIVFEADGKWIMPGIVVPYTHIGIRGDNLSSDIDETSDTYSPQLRAIDALYPFSKELEAAKNAGLTVLHIVPGGKEVFSGQTGIIKPIGRSRKEMSLKNVCGLKINFGEQPKKPKGSPSSRMGIAWIIRKNFFAAQSYLKKLQKYEKSGDEEDKPAEDAKLAVLARVLEGEIPVFAECFRADDIMTAIRISEEFKFRLVLMYATEAYKVVDEIKSRNISVIIAPIRSLWYRVERENRKIETAAILSRAGIKIAIQAGGGNPYGELDMPMFAAYTVKGGLDQNEALKAITIYPAQILGIEETKGSLKKGKDADFIILDRHPFDVLSKIENVFIEGHEVYTKEKK